MISRMTIRSGPAKFMKLARRLISIANIRLFPRVARNFTSQTSCRRGLAKVDKRNGMGKHSPYASHLERQHQLRAGLHSSGGFFPHPAKRRSVSAALFV